MVALRYAAAGAMFALLEAFRRARWKPSGAPCAQVGGVMITSWSVFEQGAHRRWLVAFCVALVLSLTSLLAPGVARASGTLDQSQTDTSGGVFHTTGPNHKVFGPLSNAQTFTAGLTGGLDRVDLYLRKTGSPTAPLTVEIRNASSGVPGSPPPLASALVPASSVSTAGGWVEVDFASPAQVTSDTQYAIVVFTTDPGTDTSYDWFVGDPFHPYSGGTLWFSRASPPTTWSEFPTVDFAFKTYVSQGASRLAAQLVSDSTGVGPGRALAHKASAIQAAVNDGQTATACADITDYLGLVRAQTGKKLTTSEAAKLTTDAANLAAALGC